MEERKTNRKGKGNILFTFIIKLYYCKIEVSHVGCPINATG